MDLQNAFIGKPCPPTDEELSIALGTTSTVWNQLLDWFAKEQSASGQEWKSSAPKYGWTLLLMLKKRRIAYLAPCAGCFQVSVILGDRAVATAREAGLPKPVLELLDQAPHYPEGTGLRLAVKNARALPAIRKLVQIKLAN
jgi:hypothetical protein